MGEINTVAEKKKAGSKAKAETAESTVTRIKAGDTKPAAINQTPTERIAKKDETVVEKKRKARKPTAKGIAHPFVATGRYFKGAWTELKLVRWPTRRATWGLTGAVLLYSAFFAVLVLLLDAGFKYLFELILGR